MIFADSHVRSQTMLSWTSFDYFLIIDLCGTCYADVLKAVTDCLNFGEDWLTCVEDVLGAGSDCIDCVCEVINDISSIFGLDWHC